MITKITRLLNQGFVILAGICLVGMILLTCSNIFLRSVWTPVRGTFELMGYIGAVMTALSLGYTQLNRGHIAVDVFFRKFPEPVVRILTALNNIFCMLFFSILAWQLSEKGRILMQTGEVTETLRIIYYPFTFGTALGCGFLAFVFLADLIRVSAALLRRKKA